MTNLFKAAALAIAATLAAGAASASSFWVQDGIHLNARSGPGTQYYTQATFSPCTKVHVIGYKWGWAQVSYNHQTYWVSAKYLQDSKCGYRAPRQAYGGHATYKPAPTYKKTYTPAPTYKTYRPAKPYGYHSHY
jgi:uncharacterized protein YraI